MKSRQTKKVRRLSRRDLEKLAADLVHRVKRHRIELEAIQQTHAPNDKHTVAEYYVRTAFGIALEHQAHSLRDIAGLAGIIYEQAGNGARPVSDPWSSPAKGNTGALLGSL